MLLAALPAAVAFTSIGFNADSTCAAAEAIPAELKSGFEQQQAGCTIIRDLGGGYCIAECGGILAIIECGD